MTVTKTLTSYIITGYDSDDHPGGDTNLIQLSYADLDFSPSASDSYKSTSGDILKVYVDGVRIYRAHDETFASGSGFLEDGDNANGQKLNGKTVDKNNASLSWSDTNDNVWTIDTSHKTVTINISNVHATNLYHNNALTSDDPAGSHNPAHGQQVKFTSGTSIIELRRAVQDLKTPAIDFSNASILTEQDLDNSAKNVFHISQQAVLSTEDAMLYDSGTGTYKSTQPGTSTSRRISSVATPVNDNDAANKLYVDGGSSAQTVAGLSDEIALLGTSAMATATTGHIPVLAESSYKSKIETVAETNYKAKVEAVAGKETEVGLLGTSAMATATTGHIPVLANVVEQTVNYTVTVVSSKFNIQGGEYGSATETPALTLIRGYTYVFDTSDSTVATHPLVFKNGSATLGTSDGVTTDSASPGSTGAKVTVVVSDSVTITKYSCSTHGDDMGNTITLRHDDFKEVADISSDITTVAGQISPTNNLSTVAGLNSELTTVSNSAYKTDIETVADSTYKTKVETVADSAYKAKVETVADSTYKGKVETVAGDTTAINSIHTNISQVTTFADTYHIAGTTEPSGSNVTEGDLWFDTANDVLKVYDGSSWGSASSSIATVASQNEFSASDGQGTDNKYFALVHDVGLELVFLNGVRLKRGNDYYCTNSNTSTTPISSGNGATFVRLETVPGTNDILSVMAFGQIANNLAVNTAGGTFTGGVTFEGQNTHNTGSNTFTMPTTRGDNNYVLTRDNSVGTGGTAWKETALGPTITSIKYSEQTSGTFVENTGQTATEASASTPELCQIIGQSFNASMTISVGGTSAGSIVVNSGGTQATFTPPSKSAGSYTLTATNPNGLNATITIAYDADPAWVTGPNADLGDFIDGSITGTNGPQIIASEDGSNLTTGYKQVTSNSDNTVITSGVAGLTIGDNGYLTGTLDGTNGAQNNFYAIAVDNEGQQSAIRQFHFVSYDTAGQGGDADPTNSGNTIKYHVFTTTGTSTFQVLTSSLTVDILLVAGGAGSGLFEGGGSGAGEVVWKTGLTLSIGTYNAIVGTGGIGTSITSNGSRGQNGGESSFAWGVSGKQIRAKGGGAGGVNGGGNQDGLSGGSGGGTSRDGGSYSPGSASKYGSTSASDQAGIGFAYGGGQTSGTSWASGAGGGGAGGAGGAGSSNGGGGDGGDGGDGGVGFKGSDVGTDVTNLMNDCSIGTLHGGVRYLAGGGGGSAVWGTTVTSRNGGAGGYGGGGAGASDYYNGENGNLGGTGTANTGGGAGGGVRGATGANGGSGIIVIRYAI